MWPIFDVLKWSHLLQFPSLAFLGFLCLWTTWMKSCLGIDSALLSIYSGKSLELTTFEKQYQRHCLENNHITKVIKQSCPRGILSLCLLSSSPQVALPCSSHWGFVRWCAVGWARSSSALIPVSGRESGRWDFWAWHVSSWHPPTHHCCSIPQQCGRGSGCLVPLPTCVFSGVPYSCGLELGKHLDLNHRKI